MTKRCLHAIHINSLIRVPISRPLSVCLIYVLPLYWKYISWTKHMYWLLREILLSRRMLFIFTIVARSWIINLSILTHFIRLKYCACECCTLLKVSVNHTQSHTLIISVWMLHMLLVSRWMLHISWYLFVSSFRLLRIF